MMRVLLLVFVSLMLVVSCKPRKSVDIKSENDKIFYTVGSMFGSRLANLDLTDAELDALYVGLVESSKSKKAAFDTATYQKKVQELFQSRMTKTSEKVKNGGKEYLEKFLKENGVKKTASGLAYKILKEGNGKKPKATDTVEVHYHGTLIDGTVFDSSVDRKKKVSFPLNRVIKGWTEGLQLVAEGGKIRLVIPSELGYGDHGAPPKIPGGATLVFDVEIFSIKDAVAAPAGLKGAGLKGVDMKAKIKKLQETMKKKVKAAPAAEKSTK